MRGRKPTPTHLKLLAGNPGKRPLPESEVQPEGELGDPPMEWKPHAKALWCELRDSLPYGVAARSDRLLFEMLVRLVAKVRADPTTLTPAMAAQIRTLGSEFGMSPSARTRLPAPPKVSKFDGLRGRDRGRDEFFND